MHNEQSNMYVQDGKFKIKLFTKSANQNSYDEEQPIGRIQVVNGRKSDLYHSEVFLLFLSSAVPWIRECCLCCY